MYRGGEGPNIQAKGEKIYRGCGCIFIKDVVAAVYRSKGLSQKRVIFSYFTGQLWTSHLYHLK